MNIPATAQELASYFDHTILKPSATEHDIRKTISEGLEYGVAAVCVHPFWVPLVSKELENSEVKCCSVVGFPSGMSLKEITAEEAVRVVELGASEVDMVINLGQVKSGDWDSVKSGISLVKKSIAPALLKVILEICELNNEEIEQSCLVSMEAGADFVKTSTGFGKSGATEEAVKLMRSTVGDKLGVKAAGGIHSFDDAMKMIKAGANRIGASSTVQILSQGGTEFNPHGS